MSTKKAIEDIVQVKQDRIYICNRMKCPLCKEDCFMTRNPDYAIERVAGKWSKVSGHQCRGKIDREMQHIPIGTDIQMALPQSRVDQAMKRTFERSVKKK